MYTLKPSTTVTADSGSNGLQLKLSRLKNLIGATPLRDLKLGSTSLYSKLEFFNYTGSIKDRPAYYIMSCAIASGEVNQDTVVIESSSGNFAIALAFICKSLGIKFIAVVDANINKPYEELLNVTAYKVFKVTERDETQGYLLNRIRLVRQLCETYKNSYWPNQYENPNNYLTYYHELGNEIADEIENLTHAFIAVSSTGTITGLSKSLKERYENCKIIGVDVEGSLIFSQVPKRRNISGIGSSLRPALLDNAIIDEVIHVSEPNIIKGCLELFSDHGIFGGGSSGATYFAIKDMHSKNKFESHDKILFICPDNGRAYLDTIFNQNWTQLITQGI